MTYELTPRGKDTLHAIANRREESRHLAATIAGGWEVHTEFVADFSLVTARFPSKNKH